MRSQAAIALALLPILLLTLLPQDASDTAAPALDFWCIACGHRGGADLLLNIALFLPLGAALRAAGLRLVVVAAIGLALSGAIEVAQMGLGGRHTALGDLLANTTGAAAGAVLAGSGPFSLRAPPSVRRQGVLTLLVVMVWVGTMVAFQPSLLERDYYGQWTAELGHYDNYHGRVVSAAVGDQPAPSRRLSSSAEARAALLDGDTLTVTALAGPPPAGLAPIFSIYDDQQEEVLLLGADGHDLVLRLRRRAADLRLEGPDLRWPDALRGAAAGDTIRLAAWRSSGAGFCLQAPGGERCDRPTIGRGWVLLLGPGLVPPALAPILDALWLIALVTLALWWAPGKRAGLVGLLALLLVAGLPT